MKKPTHIASTFYFLQPHKKTTQKKIKRACNATHGFGSDILLNLTVCATSREKGHLITGVRLNGGDVVN